MAKVIAPGNFALRQVVAVSAPWVLSIMAGITLLAALYFVFFGTPTLGRVVEYVLIVFILSGTALGYAAWNISQLKAGLLPTPKQPWQVRFSDDAVSIQTTKYWTRVPMSEVASLALVNDDSWERIRGMETTCLRMRLRNGGRVVIPQSSAGFHELLAALRSSRTIENVAIG